MDLSSLAARAHDRLDDHLAEYPLERWALVLAVTVAEKPVPNIKPHKVYELVDALADGVFFAVQVKNVKAMLLEKARLDEVHGDVAPQVVEDYRAVNRKSVRQRGGYLRPANLPMPRIHDDFFVNRFLDFGIYLAQSILYVFAPF